MGRRLAGRYVLHEQVGVGGTARVYRGYDEHLGRPVAVKVLDTRLAASCDPAGRERFLHECRTGAVVDHPAAVTVYDAGEDGDDLYLVMELVEGESLAQRLARGRLPLADALHVARQVLAVLGTIHARGIVHRDVKPSNVLLDGRGAVKLSDFGIAKRFDDLQTSMTSTGMVIGTPRYLAPEQATGSPVTPAADIYAVGVLLYEMLTGRPPFSGESALAIALAQQSGPVPDVRSERPEIPIGVAAAITAALAADPAARPATADALARALEDVASPTATLPAATVPMRAAAPAHPTMALPELPRSGHQTPRSPLMMVGVGVFALFLLAGGLVMAFGERDDPALSAGTEPEEVGTDPASAPSGPTSTASAVEEIVPGFPRTDDLLVFLAQLETNPDVVGDGGEELGRELRRALVEEDAKRRGKRIEDLRRWLPRFAEDAHVHPSIANALDELLEPLAGDGEPDRGRGPRGDRDDD